MTAGAMRVVIADDEAVARQGLRDLLSREPGVEIVGEAGDGESLIGLIGETRPDVVLLDINMPKGSGLDVVEAIGSGPMPLVIFVTAHDEHAVRAFELQALDYLVKPYREDRLRDALARARERLRQRDPGRSAYAARLKVEKNGSIRFVAMRDVRWIEAQDYCVLLHTDRERILRRGTLKQFLEALDPAVFVRVHRSAAVNVHYVRDLTITAGGGMTARLEGGTSVAVARGFRPELEARLRDLP
jgi:two-component system LytT family response regulator